MLPVRSPDTQKKKSRRLRRIKRARARAVIQWTIHSSRWDSKHCPIFKAEKDPRIIRVTSTRKNVTLKARYGLERGPLLFADGRRTKSTPPSTRGSETSLAKVSQVSKVWSAPFFHSRLSSRTRQCLFHLLLSRTSVHKSEFGFRGTHYKSKRGGHWPCI